jgi:hypothetical protein
MRWALSARSSAAAESVIRHFRSSGTSLRSVGLVGAGANAVTMVRRAPKDLARLAAWRTANSAVSDPSVPTITLR